MDFPSVIERTSQPIAAGEPPHPFLPDRPLPLTPADLGHRQQFRDYCIRDADPWHRDHLTRLFSVWDNANRLYFQEMLVPPYLMLTEPSHSHHYGDCSAFSGFGGKCQIRIRPSLLTGTHPHVQAGEAYAEGRFRFVADVLLHEAIHQLHFEITGKTDESYHGHGPAFRDVCNRIGAELGLRPVRTAKARGKDRDRPSCAQWPHCVRPADHYLGAYVRPARDKTNRDEAAVNLARLVAAAREYSKRKCGETAAALCRAALEFA